MLHHNRRTFVRTAGAATILATSGYGARAQDAPLEAARIVTGFAPGGTSDILCRRVADVMRNGTFAKNVTVDNKTGGGGQLAIQSLKGAATDGSVILQTPSAMVTIYPHIYKKLAYNPLTDLVPVTLASEYEFGLAVGPSVPAAVKTVPEFQKWCKANPAQANFGSPAAGSVPHFIGVLLGVAAGVEMKHVAYRGSQPAILDMIGGQLQAVSAPIGEFLQQAASGKLRLLGVSGAKRSRFVPDVPTFTEQGLKDMVFSEWYGFFLPAGAETTVVMRANEALRGALKAKDVVDGLNVAGLETVSSTPEELAIRLKADHTRWGPIVRKIGFTSDS
jgi:tripartite-type tricarboxylate transporter receptor subunit TctC